MDQGAFQQTGSHYVGFGQSSGEIRSVNPPPPPKPRRPARRLTPEERAVMLEKRKNAIPEILGPLIEAPDGRKMYENYEVALENGNYTCLTCGFITGLQYKENWRRVQVIKMHIKAKHLKAYRCHLCERNFTMHKRLGKMTSRSPLEDRVANLESIVVSMETELSHQGEVIAHRNRIANLERLVANQGEEIVQFKRRDEITAKQAEEIKRLRIEALVENTMDRFKSKVVKIVTKDLLSSTSADKTKEKDYLDPKKIEQMISRRIYGMISSPSPGSTSTSTVGAKATKVHKSAPPPPPPPRPTAQPDNASFRRNQNSTSGVDSAQMGIQIDAMNFIQLEDDLQVEIVEGVVTQGKWRPVKLVQMIDDEDCPGAYRPVKIEKMTDDEEQGQGQGQLAANCRPSTSSVITSTSKANTTPGSEFQFSTASQFHAQPQKFVLSGYKFGPPSATVTSFPEPKKMKTETVTCSPPNLERDATLEVMESDSGDEEDAEQANDLEEEDGIEFSEHYYDDIRSKRGCGRPNPYAEDDNDGDADNNEHDAEDNEDYGDDKDDAEDDVDVDDDNDDDYVPSYRLPVYTETLTPIRYSSSIRGQEDIFVPRRISQGRVRPRKRGTMNLRSRRGGRK